MNELIDVGNHRHMFDYYDILTAASSVLASFLCIRRKNSTEARKYNYLYVGIHAANLEFSLVVQLHLSTIDNNSSVS